MTTVSTGNPITISTTDTITGTFFVRLIQWVDDAGDMVDNDDLTLIINGVTLLVSANDVSLTSPVMWQLGPFNPAIPMKDITATIGKGAVHIWIN